MTAIAPQPALEFKPGIYPMDDPAYRALPHLSHSGLKEWVSGKKVGQKRNLLIGTAFHVLALQGGEEYSKQFHEQPEDWPLNTRQGTEKLYQLESEQSKKVLRRSEYTLIGELIKALGRNEEAAKVLKAPGQNEICVISKIPEYETKCKCLIDMRRRGCLVDLKTTGYRDHSEFKNAIVDYGYASQAAFYVDLYASITGEWLPWYFICVSKDTFECWVEPITNEQLAFGRKWYQDALRLYERYAK